VSEIDIEKEIAELVTMGYSRKECVDTIAKAAFMRGKDLTLTLLMQEVEKDLNDGNWIKMGGRKFIPIDDLKAIVEKMK